MSGVINMSKHRRTYTITNEEPIFHSIHQGFNYFHELQSSKPHTIRKRQKGRSALHSQTTLDGSKNLASVLKDNKQTYSRIKTEFSHIRDVELNDYIKKSLKYQQILNINDNKKKRLPTLNAKIGAVVKKSAVETQSKNIQHYLTTTHHKSEGWRPESRQGHTATIYKNLAVIIGGHCSAPFSSAQIYSFDTHSWVKQLQIGSARSYHSAIFYKGRFIIVFGGMGTYDVSRKCRVCFNTINLIDLQTWSSRALKMSNEESVQGRRSHGSVLMGKYMIIFGGMNTKREYLSDFVYLDLKELRWYHKEYKIEGKDLTQNLISGLAKHQMVSTFKHSHKTLPLYSSEYSDEEGIYVFGGLFGSGEDHIVSFFSFSKYNPHIRRIQYSGLSPSSIDPIVQKVNDNLLLIISGEVHERRAKLFLMKERQFVGIFKNQTAPFYGGLGSSLTRYNEELYLFFGLGHYGYINSVSSLRIEQKVTEGEGKKKRLNRDFLLDWNNQRDPEHSLSESQKS